MSQSVGGGKTPVTALQEYCVKKLAAPPIYKYIENASSAGSAKSFSCSVSVLGQTADGLGLSQKNAKQDAAAAIIKKLENSHPDIKEMCIIFNATITFNAREKLNAYCIERGFKIPTYEIINQTKLPGAPTFTAQCCVGPICRNATATTKSGANQLAAQEVLNIIKKNPPNECTQIIDEDLSTLLKTEREQLRAYRKCANLEIQGFPVNRVADRHNYFKNINSALKEQAQRILDDETNYSNKEKMDLLLRTLQIEYRVQSIPSKGAETMEFMELLCDLDVVFLAPQVELYKNVLNYFRDML